MATWTSGDNFWEYDEAQDGYTPGKVTWNYNTTSDILGLVYEEQEGYHWGGKIEASKREELIARERAQATLRAMLHWDHVYNDGRVLAEHRAALCSHTNLESNPFLGVRCADCKTEITKDSEAGKAWLAAHPENDK